jgi:MutL C terminal dimerisation domain
MAQIDGQNFDVRVVCVYGRPAAIFRLCTGPMTNLQLGGRRGNFGPCRAAIPTRNWLDALDHCAEAAGCFDSAIAGVDLVFERGFSRHFVLEVNAFGDFFPGWTEAGGQSVHALEIGETTRKFGWGAVASTPRHLNLVAEVPEGMLVLNQHALHERILFEQLKDRLAAGDLEPQRLLIPEPIDLPATIPADGCEHVAAWERAASSSHQPLVWRRRVVPSLAMAPGGNGSRRFLRPPSSPGTWSTSIGALVFERC